MKKKRKQVRLLAVTGILVAGAVVLLVGHEAIENQIRTKAAMEIGKKIFEKQLSETMSAGNQQINVSDVVDNMEKEDVKRLTGIAEKYISPENLKQAADLAASGDVKGLEALAGGQVSEADKAQLQELYKKYKNRLP